MPQRKSKHPSKSRGYGSGSLQKRAKNDESEDALCVRKVKATILLQRVWRSTFSLVKTKQYVLDFLRPGKMEHGLTVEYVKSIRSFPFPLLFQY